jgi:hypothetical protein
MSVLGPVFPHCLVKGKTMKMNQLLRFTIVVVAFTGVGFVHPTAHAQTCTAPPSGLVAWYPGDGNANDIQGGNNGTLQNGTTFVPGKVGQAFHFNGANQFVQVANTPTLNFAKTNSFSIDAWIRTTETVHNIFVATKQLNSVPFTGYGLLIGNGEAPACDASNPTPPGAGVLTAFLDNAQSSFCPPDHYLSVRGTTHLNDGQWHHVAMSYDGSSSAAGVKLFVDGAAESALVQSDNLGTGSIMSSASFTIGSRDNGGVPFNGDIDEVGVFNRALSASEIQAIVNAGSAGMCKPATLGNISTRLQVGTADRVMIAGFIVQGSAPKKVLIRAAGPSLTQFGVPNALANPRLELHDTNNTIGMNDNWQTTQIGGVITSDQVAEIQNSGLAPRDPAESALIATLAPGTYTAIVQGVSGGTGVGIVEAYDLNAASGSILANISTRGFVQTGDNVMIGGFIVVTQPTRVIIRATGPSLTQFGVPDALANPQLELHDATTSTIARNDDWQTTQIFGIITSDQVAAIQNSQLAPTNQLESAIIATLQPGNYTAIVRGFNSTLGNALVEVYALQ